MSFTRSHPEDLKSTGSSTILTQMFSATFPSICGRHSDITAELLYQQTRVDDDDHLGHLSMKRLRWRRRHVKSLTPGMILNPHRKLLFVTGTFLVCLMCSLHHLFREGSQTCLALCEKVNAPLGSSWNQGFTGQTMNRAGLVSAAHTLPSFHIF